MQTKIVTATKAQTKLSELFEWVESGNRVVFVKYGRKIGKLEPIEEKDKKVTAQEIIKWVKENAISTGRPIDTTKIIRKLRDEEHKSLGF
jgi:antitoxin (DNA-binding transcriptional repressor) of toxin-antitoxin stability system